MKLCRILASTLVLVTATTAFSKPIDNDEVLKLLGAKMSDDIILAVINDAEERKFDTSVDAIMKLKAAGATDAVIKAVLGKPYRAPAQGTTAAPEAKATSDQLTTDTVLAVNDGAEQPITYTAAETRMAARALGMGGAAIYAVLPGSSSGTSLGSTPEFIVSVPANANPVSHFQMASFAVRKNGNREVSIGGGFASVSIGIHPDRVVALSFEKLTDQSRAAAAHVLYKVKPKAAIAAGQYALVAKLTGQAGLGGAQVSGQWYDFQVN